MPWDFSDTELFLSSISNPVAIAGWLAGAVFVHRLSLSLLSAVVWAVLIEAAVTGMWPGYPFGRLLWAKVAAGIVFTGLIFAVAASVRRRRAATHENSTQLPST